MQAPTTAANSAFRLKFEDLLARAPAGTVRHHDFVRVPSNQKPWLDTGIDLAAGETVTTIGGGQTFLTGTPLSFGADFQLWYRIGPNGEAFRGTRATNSFTVETPGRLYVASYFPGEWSTREGDLATPDEAYDGVTGDLDVLILRWQGEPLDGLKRLAVAWRCRRFARARDRPAVEPGAAAKGLGVSLVHRPGRDLPLLPHRQA